MSQPSFDFEPDPGSASEADVTYSVTDVVDAVNGALRRAFGDGLWVRGEIQGWSERGAHAYFRLVEETPQGKAVLNIQLFAPSRARLRPLLERHRLRLSDGVKVRIFGHLDLFGPSGQLGLKMSGLDPRFTLGEMAMERDDVIRRLVAAGLYDANRGRPLGPVPLRVGVVTSVSSAAYADFVHEIERSGFGFRLRVVDVRVQGADAVAMVSRAVQRLGSRRDVDVVVLVRGGGAKTELATFDHEAIAQAIAQCPVPVFTGLGHEIDRTIADDVAHSAFKTPTACAAALTERVAAFVGTTEELWAAIGRRVVHRLDRADH
jgi:exodeoxyribonuclease VII large subunit